jgi:hypothetical protein
MATTGRIQEGAWDIAIGGRPESPPDGAVCLKQVYWGDDEFCTGEATDTLEPVWNAQFPVTTTRSLNNGLEYRFYDIDTIIDDLICYGIAHIGNAELSEGCKELSCDEGQFELIFLEVR